MFYQTPVCRRTYIYDEESYILNLHFADTLLLLRGYYILHMKFNMSHVRYTSTISKEVSSKLSNSAIVYKYDIRLY